jgi:hypothetical protein
MARADPHKPLGTSLEVIGHAACRARLMTCPLCRRSKEPGWLCAEHPGQPWEHGGCGAEGAPCECNPDAQLLWRKVLAGGAEERETAETIHRMLASTPRLPSRRVSR